MKPGKKPLPPIDMFWSKVIIRNHGCWKWIGARDKDGYGDLRDCRPRKAHRFSYELHFGQIPKNMLVCHHCDNPSCVNPEHLFIGSQQENLLDMARKNRRKGERNHQSALTQAKANEIRDLFNSGKFLQKELVDRFNVSTKTIYRILKNIRYVSDNHVDLIAKIGRVYKGERHHFSTHPSLASLYLPEKKSTG